MSPCVGVTGQSQTVTESISFKFLHSLKPAPHYDDQNVLLWKKSTVSAQLSTRRSSWQGPMRGCYVQFFCNQHTVDTRQSGQRGVR